MHHFRYKKNKLVCESVALAEIADRTGTPVYVYSAGTMEDNFKRLRQSLKGLDVRICYAVKANSNLAVLRHFHNLGASFDVVSGGEIRRVLAAGGSVKESVFAGVGKTAAEIELALEHGIFSFHVESEAELERINQIAGRMDRKAPVAIRVNPNIDAKTHAKITTGKSENKFGIPAEAALDAYNYAKTLDHISLRGVQIHIGSQITRVDPFVAAIEKMMPVILRLKAKFGLSYFSVGGGLGIVYQDALTSGDADWWKAKTGEHEILTPESYGRAIKPLLEPLGMQILLEPGRFLVGNAGVLLTRVEHVKRGKGRTFVIVDAAMNDLIRPAMYAAWHEIVPVEKNDEIGFFSPDIVGPVCETGDTFARKRELQRVAEGELLAVMSAGAYGFVMASRYNTRPLPAEVLVKDAEFAVVSARESFDQIVANETIPEFL
ncbi:MAG: diaminopimelate decarboxylase [Opitutales bacterium]